MYENLKKNIQTLTAQLVNAKEENARKDAEIADLKRQLKAIAVSEKKKSKEVANEQQS